MPPVPAAAVPPVPQAPQPERPGVRPAVTWLKRVRPLHRWVGVPLTLLIVVSSLTGVLLAWKKQSALLQPPLQRGASLRPADWQSLERVGAAAEAGLRARLGAPAAEPLPLERLEVRPSHGVAKALFERGYWEVQVDLTTGRVLSVERRTSDFIEALHDGSLVGERFKALSMSVLGLGLLLLSLSGLWLWYGPQRLRRAAALRGVEDAGPPPGGA